MQMNQPTSIPGQRGWFVAFILQDPSPPEVWTPELQVYAICANPA